jgi:hypothetical protein
LTLDRAGLLINALVRAVTINVSERATLARIQNEWNRVLGGSRESMISAAPLDSADIEDVDA